MRESNGLTGPARLSGRMPDCCGFWVSPNGSAVWEDPLVAISRILRDRGKDRS